MKILIAEDDAVSRILLQAMLEQSGHQVIAACDGAEALRLLNLDEAPRLAILDWIMPEMTGIEVCKAIRAHSGLADRYLILLTSNNRKEDSAEGLAAGANDYIVKPFDSGELRARVAVGIQLVEAWNSLNALREETDCLRREVARLKG